MLRVEMTIDVHHGYCAAGPLWRPAHRGERVLARFGH
jgi:hypothetical protein